jgi:hypothetical protein
MRSLLVLVLLTLAGAAAARGLNFSEEMHGYSYWDGEFRQTSVYLDVRIPDIDAWRSNPNHAASVTGYVAFDGGALRALSGQLQIMAQAPGGQGRLLVYRLDGSGFRYVGAKHVRDDRGFDAVDDMTRLRGVFRVPGESLPAPLSLWTDASWTSEIYFEWWQPSVLWDFAWSFDVTNAWWWEHLTVKLLFLDTFMGGLAEEFFPWLY